MRTILITLISFIVALHTVNAQIKTYDIKTYSGNIGYNSFLNFHQISPTRTFALTRRGNGIVSIVALNEYGIIEQQWRSNFHALRGIPSYYYDRESNTLVYLETEFISTSGSVASLRLVLLDSNLIEKSNVVLDSTITGMPTEFDKNINFTGIRLLDSSILWMSYPIPRTEGKEQIILHFSKDGRFIDRASIIDTTELSFYDPQLQMHSGKILFINYISYNKYFKRTLVTSDTSFNFEAKPIIDSTDLFNGAIDGANEIISTSDGGICLGYYFRDSLEMYKAVIVKYDKNFQKQWTTSVPGYNGLINGILQIIESRNSGYYVSTGAINITEYQKYPQYWEDCFQDITLSRIDTAGNLLFTAYYGTELCTETTYSMIEDADGGIIISGEYSVHLSNSPCESLCTGADAGWLFKVDSLGEPAKNKV
ncbi:MAG: hypothetical protein JST20_10290, partial [Bacteroidetes bacterium]|nr:hypothetical protein [Bacteroidota bacterium]